MPYIKTAYVCDYCKGEYRDESQALECLNSHDILFMIEALKGSHDCFGAPTLSWKKTDKIFKKYESAMEFCKKNGSDCFRIVFMPLS